MLYLNLHEKKKCDDLYSEVSNCVTLENFESILDYATKEEHDALVIDFTTLKKTDLKRTLLVY